jgi:diguanylate cyclase (GGDEF)-like protein
MWGKIESNGFWQGEIWNKRKSGEIYAELLSVTSLKDSNGKTQFYIGIFSDISQVKDQQKQLDLLAYYDPLTRLPNRTLLSKKFDEAVARAEKTHSLLGVIFIDLDNFKPVNDQYGHEVGDALLISVSNSIQSCIREGDTLSRLGGDEFVLLLNDLQTTKQAEYTCERILDRLKAEREVLGYALSVTASLGMTFYPNDDSDIDTLLRHADQAMYLAKQEGKHRYKIYDLKTQNELVSLNRRLNDINQALDKQQLKLFYQPKVNLVTGEVFGAEALIRWIHPVKGVIPPLSFLPIIQGTELEIAVGNWVIDQALSQLSAWNLQGNRLEVSVNISSNHLLHPDFINNLSNTLAAYSDVEAKQLQLEILESEQIRDINEMRQVIRVCQNDLGLSVALDDFGTGYSSLTHARSLSADLIKIDQSFVRDMLDDPDDFVIVDSVVKLAGSFKQSVIAEGIETIEHGLLLISMGCIQGQGYGISRPIPAEEFSDWLNHYQPFSEWIEFADKQYSNKQIRLLRLKLTVRRWHIQFIEYINSDDADNAFCPILDKDKCHCGIWLTSEANDLVFDDKTLSELDEHHEDFHQVADDMLRLFIQGEVSQARDNIVLFEKRYQAFEQLINTLGQE